MDTGALGCLGLGTKEALRGIVLNQPDLRLPYDIDLKQIFRKMITTGGSHKVLFGTDSTFFPRGWRINVLEAQVQACMELKVDGLITDEDIQKIFYGNIKTMAKL
jgi:predicted TIM-barrel fold metal-dependent hydrolase